MKIIFSQKNLLEQKTNITDLFSDTNINLYKTKINSKFRPLLSTKKQDITIQEQSYFPEIKNKISPNLFNITSEYYENTTTKKDFDTLSNSNNSKLNSDLQLTNHNFFIINKETRIENPTSFYGCFYLGPFEPGQGLTIGNTLRRSLLSSIIGIAITAVEIEGISHEYSTIPGVKETVLDILLALNETVLMATHNFNIKKSFIGYLKKTGPGVIYAKDLRLPQGIECVDPNHYIATLSDKGTLNLKFQIQIGKSWKETQGKNWHNPPKEKDSIYMDSLIPNNYSEKDRIERPWSELKMENEKQLNNIDNSFNSSLQKIKQKKTYNSSLINLKKSITLNKNIKNLTLEYDISLQNEQFETLPLLLNPIFTPIKKINYLVDNFTNFSEKVNSDDNDLTIESDSIFLMDKTSLELFKTKTNLEIVILEVWTNGSIHPKQALSNCLYNCTNLFSKFSKIEF